MIDKGFNIFVIIMFIGVGFLIYKSISASNEFKRACIANGGVVYSTPTYGAGPRNPILKCVVDNKIISTHQYRTKNYEI